MKKKLIKTGYLALEASLRNFFLMTKVTVCLVCLTSFITTFGVINTAYAQQQEKKISGNIVDNNGISLPGVAVLIVGTTIGVMTDSDGNYSIPNIPANATLQFSFVGMKTQEIPVGNKTTIKVVMQEEAIGIEEVVAIGYGTQRKVNITGSISTISDKELRQIPVVNLSNAVAGRLSGVIATNGNGRPGSGSNIAIRGISTLNSNSALVVVDGIVRDNFDNINPNDVQSISVLKDASSAAIYGARAANGVFLITTKRGNIGKPVISYSGRVGILQPTQYPKLMSPYEFGTLRNKVLINSGKTSSDPSYYSNEQLDNFRLGKGTVDWYKETFKKYSVETQHNLSINGGSEAVRYFASLEYFHGGGMYDEINFGRYNLRTNVDARISKSLNVGINLEGGELISNTSGYDANTIFQEVIQTTSLVTAYYPDGKPVNTSGQNPAEMIRSSGHGNTQNNLFAGTLFFDQKLSFVTEGLSLKGTISVIKKYDFSKKFLTPYPSYNEDNQGNITNIKVNGGKTSLDENYNQAKAITENISLNYARTLNKHDLGALFLYEQFSSDGNTFGAHKEGFAVNLKEDFFASGPLNQSILGNGFINDYRRSLVGRFNYAYDKKYLFETTFRYDGSYRFPKGKRYGLFPAISLGWRISEESFFKNSEGLKFVDNLKLRVSKGIIGNDRVAPFQFQDAYSIITNIGPVMGGNALPLINYGVNSNQDITWEKQENNNIGLESSFLNSKLGFEFDYFFRTTKDILWTRIRSVPETFGRSLSSENYASLSSHGLEFTLSHQNTIGAVNYKASLIGSFATNKVTRIDDPANALDYQKQIGRPVGYVAGFEALGFFQSQDEADKWFGGYEFGQKSIAGDIKYADVDKDGIITQNDQKVLSNYGSTPAIVFGLSGDIRWKGFYVNFLIQGAAKRTLLLSGYGRQAFRSGGAVGTFEYLLDSWSPDNKDAKYPIATLSPRSIDDKNSEIWLKKAAFARLKSVNIGYTLNPNILKKYNIQSMTIFISGFNLATLSQVKEFDPEAEVGNGSYYPQQRNMNIGLNFSF